MAATTAYAHLSIGDRLAEIRAEADGERERTYLQLRRELDIGAFGVHAIRADAGQALVEERTALGYHRDAHEELYVVLAGRAAFTVGGEALDGRTGTAVFVREVDAERAVRAEQDGTILLVVGGRRGEAWRPTLGEASQEFFRIYETQDYEGAMRVSEEILETYPGNGLALYNIACMESLLGRTDDAVAHLREALEDAPTLRENARTDDDFAALREDARFVALVA